MLLSHQGGLAEVQFKTTFNDIGDHKKISKLLSDMTPAWPPGMSQKISSSDSMVQGNKDFEVQICTAIFKVLPLFEVYFCCNFLY